MRRYALSLLLLLVPAMAFAQSQTGFPPYGTFQDGQFDVVNVESLNSVFAIPIVSSPGRGLNLNFALTYNTSVWELYVVQGWVVGQFELEWGGRGFTVGATMPYAKTHKQAA